MSLEELAANIENMTIGLDDTFQFHCTRCGMCCLNREDIILSPMDIYKMAKELNLTPSKFFAQYCQTHIGDNSRMPIIRLQPIGDEMRCPLLKNHKCSVHKVKPAVCALYPLGRYIALEKGDYSAEGVGKSEVKYLLQPIECGDNSQTHTVREWLADFDIKLEDEAFAQDQPPAFRHMLPAPCRSTSKRHPCQEFGKPYGPDKRARWHPSFRPYRQI